MNIDFALSSRSCKIGTSIYEGMKNTEYSSLKEGIKQKINGKRVKYGNERNPARLDWRKGD
jgi:hypothetical protein